MAYLANSISEHLYRTPEGYLICKDVPIGRTGKIQYLASELGLEGNDIITVYRSKEENASPQTIASFEGKPITEGHPDVDVDGTNYNYYQKGHVQNVRANDNFLIADLFITDESLINEILNGNKREVSCGYDTIYKQSGNTLFQTHIRGNHVAVVEEGRAGGLVKIRDKNTIINKLRRDSIMGKVEEILLNYKRKIKKVRSIDEMNELIDKTQDDLEEALGTTNSPADAGAGNPPADAGVGNSPADAGAGNSPANVGVGNSPADAGAGNPMAEVMAAIKSLNAKVDSLVTGKPQSDGTPEGDLDKAMAELGNKNPNQLDSGELLDDDIQTEDEDPINKDDKGVTSAAAENELEDVQSVDGKELEPNEIPMDETVAKDAALAMLKSARAAIANISNPAEKRKVVDSILKSVKGLKGKSTISDVMKVRNKAMDSKALDSAAIENAYMKQNPHMKAKLGIK